MPAPKPNTDAKVQLIHALDDKRAEQGISEADMSAVVGYSTNGWAQAVRYEAMSNEKMARAAVALAYHEEHGMLPLPHETELPTLYDEVMEV